MLPTLLHAVQSPCLDISCATVTNMTGNTVVLFSAALTADGTVWTWGSNTDCQLGRPLQEGSASDPNCPRAVAGPGAAHTGAMSCTPLYTV